MRLKKISVIMLAIVMCFTFTACQDNDGNNKKQDEGNLSKSEQNSEPDKPIAEEEEADLQVVGTDEFGYVAVPNDWVKFNDLDGGTDFQYSNISGTSIITLNVFDDEGMDEEQKNQLDSETVASYIWQNLENNDVTNITGAKVTVNGHDAVQVYGEFLSQENQLPSIIVCWIVEDEQGVFRYISAEGTLDDISEVVSYVESSYSF